MQRIFWVFVFICILLGCYKPFIKKTIVVNGLFNSDGIIIVTLIDGPGTVEIITPWYKKFYLL